MASAHATGQTRLKVRPGATLSQRKRGPARKFVQLPSATFSARRFFTWRRVSQVKIEPSATKSRASLLAPRAKQRVRVKQTNSKTASEVSQPAANLMVPTLGRSLALAAFLLVGLLSFAQLRLGPPDAACSELKQVRNAQPLGNQPINIAAHNHAQAAPERHRRHQRLSRRRHRQAPGFEFGSESTSLGVRVNKSLMLLGETKKADSGESELLTDAKGESLRRLLVRELTSLIMNHDPETIAEHMEGAKVSGELVSESGTQRAPLEEASAQVADAEAFSDKVVEAADKELGGVIARLEADQRKTPADDGLPLVAPSLRARTSKQTSGLQFASYLRELQADQLPSPSTLSPLEGELLDEQEQNRTEEQARNSAADQNSSILEDSYVTCPPDYEDTSFVEPNKEQQLLANADSSQLQNEASLNPSENNSNRQYLAPQCVHTGWKMIEMITKVITPILFSIIIVVGLLGNILVMLVILEDRKTERELTPTNLLILDLSLADLSFIIFCIPFTGWDYSVGHWVFGALWCKFNQYLIVVCALSSIYTLVLMSVDRFMAIVYPIECISYRTSKNTLYAIYIKWIIILLVASPTIPMHGLIELPSNGPEEQFACRFLTEQYNPLHFQIAFFVTSYLFPLVLIFCLYWSLLNKLWFGSKPHGHKESLKMLESKKKVTWLVAGIVIVFALCWCPIQVMLILMRLKTYRITATYVAIQVFAHILGYMNSCINPIVYAFASETFHNSLKRSKLGRFLLCKRAQQDQHHPTLTSQHNHTNQQSIHRQVQQATQPKRISRPALSTCTTTSLVGGVPLQSRALNNNNNNKDLLKNASTSTSSGSKGSPSPMQLKQIEQSTSSNQLQRASASKDETKVSCSDSRNFGSTSPLRMNLESQSELGASKRSVNLPLVPRDRDIMVPAAVEALASSADNVNRSDTRAITKQPPLPAANDSNQQQQQQPQPAQQAAQLAKKHQLVARATGSQVLHRCEPCYEQEMLKAHKEG